MADSGDNESRDKDASTSTNPTTTSRMRKRKPVSCAKAVHQPSNRPKRVRKAKVEKVETDEFVRWTYLDREKLLEALYRYSPLAVESISTMVETKTPKQVEQFIEKLRNASVHGLEARYITLESEKEAAPVELWLSLLEEVCRCSYKKDLSKHYTEVMELMARNEPMTEPSGIKGLSWKNIYSFICELLMDKPAPRTLTNIESLVVLDMMHNVGDTLHMSDTTQQRRLLDLKYQLFKWQTVNRRPDFATSMAAIHNDFTKIQFTPHFEIDGCKMPEQPPPPSSTLLTATAASTSSAPPPSTSSATASSSSAEFPSTSAGSPQPPSPTVDSLLQTELKNHHENKLADLNFFQHPNMAGETSSDQLKSSTSTTNQSNMITSSDPAVVQNHTISLDVDELKSSTSTTDLNSSTQRDQVENVTNTLSTPNPAVVVESNAADDNIPSTSQNDKEDDDDREKEDEELEAGLEGVPKLFTLNPLTIPTEILCFGPKKEYYVHHANPTEIEIDIDNQLNEQQDVKPSVF